MSGEIPVSPGRPSRIVDAVAGCGAHLAVFVLGLLAPTFVWLRLAIGSEDLMHAATIPSVLLQSAFLCAIPPVFAGLIAFSRGGISSQLFKPLFAGAALAHLGGTLALMGSIDPKGEVAPYLFVAGIVLVVPISLGYAIGLLLAAGIRRLAGGR